jgi:hypothetical protein
MRTVQKTIRRTVLKKPTDDKPSAEAAQRMSSTMQISADDLFDELPADTVAHLDLVCPGQHPCRIELDSSERLIGRDEDADIPIPLTNVSWHHARITCRNEEYTVEDLDSTNGTFVNGLRVSRCVLRNSDQVRIGEARLQFERIRSGAPS